MTESKMTIYYRKSTGSIEGLCPLTNDMSWYGTLQSDYELTHAFLVVDSDDYVAHNLQMFKIVNGALKLKNDTLSKYM